MGERHAERGPLALFAFHIDLAVHHVDNTLGNRHAEATAAVLESRGCVFLGERVENLGQEFLADADTGIANLEDERRLVVERGNLFHVEVDVSALRGELDRIAQDVDENLANLGDVADVVVV